MAYIDVAKIENIRFMCHKILPLVYDESLSYYEVLCKVANKLNETIDATNQLEDNVSVLNDNVNTLTDRVNTIASEINTFEAHIIAEFNRLESEITTTVDDKMREVDNKIGEMDRKIAQIDNEVEALRTYIYGAIEQLTVETQTLINEAIKEINVKFDKAESEMRIYVYNQLENAIKELPEITSIMVVNPVSHKVTTIQVALDSLFENTRYNALTCDEFNSLGLTINELNSLKAHSIPRGWTIIEWLTYAKEWLKLYPEHKAFKPDDGRSVDYHEVIEFNTDMFRLCGALTLAEVDALGLTYDEFVAYGMTAQDIAWRSNRILV